MLFSLRLISWIHCTLAKSNICYKLGKMELLFLTCHPTLNSDPLVKVELLWLHLQDRLIVMESSEHWRFLRRTRCYTEWGSPRARTGHGEKKNSGPVWPVRGAWLLLLLLTLPQYPWPMEPNQAGVLLGWGHWGACSVPGRGATPQPPASSPSSQGGEVPGLSTCLPGQVQPTWTSKKLS